jgi:hypothetical protein
MKVFTIIYKAGNSNCFGIPHGEYAVAEHRAFDKQSALEFFTTAQFHSTDEAVAIVDGPFYSVSIASHFIKEPKI